jgi:hypothetical protein
VSRVYPPRTRANVRDSDATLWFGSTDSGDFRTTHDAALTRGQSYPFLTIFVGDRPPMVRARLVEHQLATLNVAGNCESSSPLLGAAVERFLRRVFRGRRGGRRVRREE